MDAPRQFFDFTKGGRVDDVSYPPLRPLEKACTHRAERGTSEFAVYEPGNGTRYEVLFARRGWIPGEIMLDPADDFFPRTVVAILNFGRPCVMVLPEVRQLGLGNIDYMCKKMGIDAGDAYALIPLINDFLERQRGD